MTYGMRLLKTLKEKEKMPAYAISMDKSEICCCVRSKVIYIIPCKYADTDSAYKCQARFKHHCTNDKILYTYVLNCLPLNHKLEDLEEEIF